MKNSNRKLTALTLASVLLLSGCQTTTKRDDDRHSNHNNADIEFNTTINYDELERCSYDATDFNSDYSDYSFRLMAQVLDSEARDTNVMISPASIMFALDLAAAGANGDTLTQITNLFADGEDPMEQQAFAANMMVGINSSQGVAFNSANAVWTNESLIARLNPDYQDYIEEYFDAEAYSLPFNDDTVDVINSWIEENTNGMIDRVLDNLEPDAAAVLVNAIAFEGAWNNLYDDSQVYPMTFTTAHSEKIEVGMLCDVLGTYYETDEATGFIRYYEGGRYAFLVMLPEDDSLSANEFLSEFTSDDYNDFISSETNEYFVYTRLPEFESDYEITLNGVLEDLGVTDAFDENSADFTGIGAVYNDADLYIGSVIHKTHIELDRNGTSAAAATVDIMTLRGCGTIGGETREVYCDRPFAYAIVDTETMNPIFFGTYNG